MSHPPVLQAAASMISRSHNKALVTMGKTDTSAVTAGALSLLVEDFLAAGNPTSVMEDGLTLFDLAQSRYSISDSAGKCLLHLWSEERNIVRRVLAAERKNGTLRLTVQR